ncbi:heme-dependent oxidative N-demethylase family protein [Algihabitans albus]|uniref:heme-dependent oxidative N-demethylase family protein n=1 Tax=Algihabitans albus TaxID=2164067 RepID=UPI000E5D65CB|nr:DUF3445 domain-containing protein [Algihabitans albus]
MTLPAPQPETERASAFAYTPFDGGPYRLAMGLLALKPEAWIEIDRHYDSYLAEKQRLLAERSTEVFAALPEAAAASRELRDRLAAHLTRIFPERFRQEGRVLTNLARNRRFDLDGKLHPLDLAGRLVQEDLCLMQAGPEGYRLTAASLCFPTRWRLRDKLGHPMGRIHGPVPFYGEKLERPVDRFFERMKADKPVWRLNWSLTDDPALFQPTGHSRPDVDLGITAENVGARVFFRVERQTLCRLPISGAICFGIRIHQNPLSDVEREPGLAARLAAALRQLPEEVLSYKSVTVFHAPLLSYLDRVAAGDWRSPCGKT